MVVGQGGITSLPPQLRPGGSKPPASAVQGRGHPGSPVAASRSRGSSPDGSKGRGEGRSDQRGSGDKQPKGGVAGEGGQQLQYVSHQWVEQSLARQQLLPPADYPPPDPDAQVHTPTAVGG